MWRYSLIALPTLIGIAIGFLRGWDDEPTWALGNSRLVGRDRKTRDLIVITTDGSSDRLRHIDPKTGRDTRPPLPLAPLGSFPRLVWSEDGRRFAVRPTLPAGWVRVVDAETGRTLAELRSTSLLNVGFGTAYLVRGSFFVRFLVTACSDGCYPGVWG
jgi:hypothetical protein